MPGRPLSVVVIGAGPGGLCLAHGLRRTGITVTVHERDRSATARGRGHLVHIDRLGRAALRACLPPELFRTLLAAGALPPRRFLLLDRRLRVTAATELPEPAGQPSVSQGTLRQLLLTGLEDIVRFGRVFSHHLVHADGDVTACFTDGSAVRADLVVLADGPAPGPAPSRGPVLIGAKVPLVEESRTLLPDAMARGIGLVRAPRGIAFLLHWAELPWDRFGEVKPEVAAEAAALLARWPRLLFDGTRDFIDVAVRGPVTRFPSDLLRYGGAELLQLLLDLTPRLHPDLRSLLALGDPATGFALVRPGPAMAVRPVDSGAVTALGDAARAGRPRPGGANSALRDALALCAVLADVRAGRTPLADALCDYEAAATRHTTEAAPADARSPLAPPTAERLLLDGPPPGRLLGAGLRERPAPASRART